MARKSSRTEASAPDGQRADLANSFILDGDIERASFRNGLRYLTQHLSNQHIPINQDSSKSLVEALSDEFGKEKSGELAFAAGLAFANEYQRAFAELAVANRRRLGQELPSLLVPWGGLPIASSVEPIGASLENLLTARPSIAANLGLAADERARLQALSKQFSEAFDASHQAMEALRSALEQLGDEAVKDIVNQIEEELTQIAIKELQEELGIDDTTLELILALRESVGDIKSIKLKQLLTLRNIGNVLFTHLLYTGQCVCFSVDCPPPKAVCMGYYLYMRYDNWEATWDNLGQELINFSLPEPYLTAVLLAQQARAFFDALEKLKAFEDLRRVPRAIAQLKGSVETIAAIEWDTAITSTVSGHLRMLGPLEQSQSALPELCAVATIPRTSAQQESCALQVARQTVETQFVEIIRSLRTTSESIKFMLGEEDGGFLDPVILEVRDAQRAFDTTVGKTIDQFYAQLNVLQQKARLPELSNAVEEVLPLLNRVDVNLYDFRDRAIALADINEGALARSEALVTTAMQRPATNPVQPDAPALPDGNYPFLIEQLVSLYAPYQDRSLVLARLGKSRSPFIFFRQFPPLFYQYAMVQLETESSLDDLRSAVARFRGWTVGDPHLQNFGVVYPLLPPPGHSDGDKTDSTPTTEALRDIRPPNEWGDFDPCSRTIPISISPKVVMNDPDDGGEGSPLLDITRFLSGLEMFRPTILEDASGELLAAYKSGLSGSAWSYSSRVASSIAASQPKIERCKLKLVFEPRRNFRSRSDEIDGTEDLSPEELSNAIELVQRFVGSEAAVTASYKYQRLNGGSGGNWRWELAVTTPAPREGLSDIEYWVEVKALGPRPGNSLASHVEYGVFGDEPRQGEPDAIEAAMSRYQTSLYLTLGDEAITSTQVVNTISGPAFLRFRLAGQGSFGIRGLSDQDLIGLAADELYILGQVHRRGFGAWLGEDQTWAIYSQELERLLPQVTSLAKALARSLSADYDLVASHDMRLFDYLDKKIQRTDEDERELARLSKLIKERAEQSELAIDDDEVALEIDQQLPPDLTIREINFRPRDPACSEQLNGYSAGDFEFVSLMNNTTVSIDADGLEFDRGFDVVLPSLIVQPGGLLVIARNAKAVQSRYIFPEGTQFLEDDDVRLAKNGERIRLLRHSGDTRIELADFEFSGDWMKPARGSESITSVGSLPDFEIPEGALIDMEAQSSWLPTRPVSRQSDSDLVPSFVMFNSGKGKKHDFVLFQNIAASELPLDHLRILGTNLIGSLPPNSQLAMVQDTATFGNNFPEFNGMVVQYDAKLGNNEDSFMVSCRDESLKAVAKYDYKASDWTPEVNGGGSGLVATNICRMQDGHMAVPSWRPAAQMPGPDTAACSATPALNSCGDNAIGESWSIPIVRGAMEFECRSREGGPIATYLRTTCIDGNAPPTGLLTCVP